MKLAKVFLACFVPLVWCINEALSITASQNKSSTQSFTIDAAGQNSPDPTAPASTQSINLFLPENSHMPTKITTTTTSTAKTIPTTVEVLKSTERIREPTPKRQSWQIPSPLSPLSTSDPKATNSSKRQTEFINQFVPSQEIGSYDNTEGFVPHVGHEPKFIRYTSPPQLQEPEKPTKQEAPFSGYAYSEPRLPPGAAKGLQSFEHDFEDLKSKYPELNDLVSNYPIMEEIMKQKLAEKFEQSYYASKQRPPTQHSHSQHSSEDSREYGDPKDYHTTLPSKLYDKPLPSFTYEPERNKWQSHPGNGKKPSYIEGSSTAETPFEIPAGEYYQEPKFPIIEYHPHHPEDNTSNISLETMSPPKQKMTSPWKKILHLVTAILPIGILLTALTPNVITISNVADKNYPMRQRSSDADAKVVMDIIDFLRGNALKGNDEDHECDERRFCEMSTRGKHDEATMIEKIFWTLAHSTPERVSEAVGVKKLFKAVKNDQCFQYVCKKRHRHHQSTTTSSTIVKDQQEAPKGKRRTKRLHKMRS